MKKFNWDYLYWAIREKTGYTLGEYAKVKLHKSGNYLPSIKGQNRRPPENIEKFMIKDLDLDTNTLWEIDEPKKVSIDEAVEQYNELVAKSIVDEKTKDSDIAHELMYDELTAISKKLDEQNERLERVAESIDRMCVAIEQSPSKKSPLEHFIKAMIMEVME